LLKETHSEKHLAIQKETRLEKPLERRMGSQKATLKDSRTGLHLDSGWMTETRMDCLTAMQKDYLKGWHLETQTARAKHSRTGLHLDFRSVMRLDFLMETRSGIPKANVKVMLMGTERCWHLEMPKDFQKDLRSETPKERPKDYLMDCLTDSRKDSCLETQTVTAICWWMGLRKARLKVILTEKPKDLPKVKEKYLQKGLRLEMRKETAPQEKEKRKETDLDFHLDLQMAIQTVKGLSTPMDSHSDFHLAKRRGFETETQMDLDLSTPKGMRSGFDSATLMGWHSETVRCLWTERLKVNPRERQMDS